MFKKWDYSFLNERWKMRGVIIDNMGVNMNKCGAIWTICGASMDNLCGNVNNMWGNLKEMLIWQEFKSGVQFFV